MKVLLFSHKSDIDGMGSVILAKLAFTTVEYVLCETFNLEKEIEKYYKTNHIYDFDKIFITDLWLEEPLLTKVANDKKLRNKIYIFDHHESALLETTTKYSFATIKISDTKGLCCGTSLFFAYLLNNNYISNDNLIVTEFVELTREYDTWEWTTKYHNDIPQKLTLLFNSIGCNEYINLMFEKLNKNFQLPFFFNDLEKKIIENKTNSTKEKILNYVNKINYIEILGKKAGLIFIDYEYRNDLAEYLRNNKYEIDFVMLVALDYGTISYRSIKDNVNVRLIAEAFGGKGHDKTASSPISPKIKKDIINLLTKMPK